MNMKKPKLCAIIPNHWTALMGGSQYQLKCLFDDWIPKKYFDLYCITRNAFMNADNIGYKLFKIKSLKKLSKYGLLFESYYLYQTLKRVDPDVIYQNIGTSFAGVAAYYAKKYQKKMILHLASDNDIKKAKFSFKLSEWIPYIDKIILDYGLKNSDRIIAQTEDQKILLKENFGKTAHAIVPNFQPFPKEEINKSLPIKVIWVANIKPLKQPELFIRLAQDLQNIKREVQFIMIGDSAKWRPEWQRKLETDIESIPNLSYLGPLPVDTVNEMISKSHIFVNTSLFEGFANTFIQSWFREVPVVSLNCNPDNILKKFKIGYHCGSYQRMLEVVKDLINNDELREKMGADAREYAHRHHSLKNTDTLYDIINNTLK